MPELGQWFSDEFASGIVKFLFGAQRGLPIWLAIVAQCYRNVHDILGGLMTCGTQTNARRWAEQKKVVLSFDSFDYGPGPDLGNTFRPVKLEWFEYIRSNELLAEVDEHTELMWGVDPTK